jgi:hypothetical protein
MNIFHEAKEMANQQHLIQKGFEKNLTAAYGNIKDTASIERVNRILDGQAVAASSEEAAAVVRVRGVLNDMQMRAQLDPADWRSNYFPHPRAVVDSKVVLKINASGERPVGRSVPQDYRAWYEKKRTLPDDETLDYGIGPMRMYARAVAKRIAVEGGVDLDGVPVHGFIKRIPQHLASLPEVPEIQNYWKQYVNDMVHGREVGSSLLTPQQANVIKSVEFLRTIGGNVMSAITNLTQTLNTGALVDTRSWTAAWYDIFTNPELRKLARSTGVVSQDLGKFGLETLANPTKLEAVLQSGTKAGGYIFSAAEETNRLHAFAAGLRDAKRAGLAGADAVDYAKMIVDKGQFRFGAENLPGWGRGGNPVGSVIGQFKSYQMNQLQFMRNLVTDNPRGAMKYILGTALLAGSDVVTGSDLGHKLRKNIADMLGGDPQDYKFRGLLGEMGVYLGNQLGIGAFPAEDMRSLLFLIPGPAMGHILTAASAASGNNYDISALADGSWGKPLTPDQRASKMVASFPVAGVPLNRVRQAVVLGQTTGPNTKSPETMGQAFGVSSPTGKAGRPIKDRLKETLNKGVGIPSQAAEDDWVARQRTRQDKQDWLDMLQEKATAIRRGDIETIKDINEESIRRFGRILAVTPGTMRKVVEEQNIPATERGIRRTPKPIRGRARSEAQD